VADLVDRLHHRMVVRVSFYVFDKNAVNLQKIHRQASEVRVGRQTGSKVIERELDTDDLQPLDELNLIVKTVDR
jgi:hypothetical protein